jgi:DNA polymerase III epsilon subunit-like protein
MVLILAFDTETIGLPPRPSYYKRFPHPVDEYMAYSTSRLIEIAYVLYDTETNQTVKVNSVLCKPVCFKIENSNIHGISHEFAEKHGESHKEVLKEFIKYVACADILVAHNIEFDKNIIISELTRYGLDHNVFDSKKYICTMKLAMQVFGLTRFIRLIDLNKRLFDEDWKQEHRALDDTFKCLYCYVKLITL